MSSYTFNIFKRVVTQMLVIAAFLLTAVWVILVANGYSYDFENKEIVQSSILDINVSFQGVRVILDGEEIVGKLPFQKKDLSSGYHSLSLEHPAFFPWKKRFKAFSGFAVSFDRILLIPRNIQSQAEVLPTTSPLYATFQDQFPVQLDGLSPDGTTMFSLRGSELFQYDLRIQKETLITRFSSKIKRASWYFDSHHLLVLTEDGTLYVMEQDGQNLLPLMSLSELGDFRSNEFENSFLLYDGERVMSLDLQKRMEEMLM